MRRAIVFILSLCVSLALPDPGTFLSAQNILVNIPVIFASVQAMMSACELWDHRWFTYGVAPDSEQEFFSWKLKLD